MKIIGIVFLGFAGLVGFCTWVGSFLKAQDVKRQIRERQATVLELMVCDEPIAWCEMAEMRNNALERGEDV